MEKSQIRLVEKSHTSWLPYCERTQQFKFSALIGEEITNTRWPQILKKRYTEFDNICCVASRSTTQRIILKDGIQPKQSSVLAWSGATRRNQELSFVLFTPNTNEQVLMSFGVKNRECLFAKFVISVAGDEGIVDQQFRRSYDSHDSDDDIYYWNHYFLEILDTDTTSICRILASKKSYDHLLRYDPTELGGPWYWDVTCNKHYYLHRMPGYDGHMRNVAVEFLRESDIIGLSKPGPDWSVVRDIEFVWSDEMIKFDAEDVNNTSLTKYGNHSAMRLELFRFLVWYSGLPIEQTGRLTDIPGLKKRTLGHRVSSLDGGCSGPVSEEEPFL